METNEGGGYRDDVELDRAAIPGLCRISIAWVIQ
jgi:hypothetical protein